MATGDVTAAPPTASRRRPSPAEHASASAGARRNRRPRAPRGLFLVREFFTWDRARIISVGRIRKSGPDVKGAFRWAIINCGHAGLIGCEV